MNHLLSEEEIALMAMPPSIVGVPVSVGILRAIAAAEHQKHVEAGWRSPEEVEALKGQAYLEGVATFSDSLKQARQSERENIIAYLVGVRATCQKSQGDIVTSIIQHIREAK